MASREWYIRDVDEATRKWLKLYALKHDLTLAQALAKIIKIVESVEGKNNI